jgi:methyltransferase (TIGR00027 family)
MVNLNAVSETALLTLKARVLEAEKPSPLIRDPKGREILEKITARVSSGTLQRVLNRRMPASLTSYLALRARKYDSCTRDFLDANPGGWVISLGCGFDTRYWRISGRDWHYVEIDLPEVIQVKKEILENAPEYEMIGCSVLEDEWIEYISSGRREKLLFLAEGLFMYLEESDAISLFRRLAGTFSGSQLVFEIIQKKYTRGFRKKMVESRIQRASGTAAGESYNFGIKEAGEIETYANNIRVVDEWSYFEDPDIRPGFLRLFRHFRSFARTQWTIRARID